VLKAIGLDIWAAGLCFGLCAMVTTTIVQEYWRGANVRQRNSGTDFITALIGLVARNKRRYGGYIVHVGIVLVFLGFAGNAYKKDEQVALKRGATVTLGKYTLRNDGIKVHDDGQKQMTTAYIAVLINGQQVDTLYPAKWVFRGHEAEPTTEVGIRRSIGEDLYVVMPSNDPQTMASQVAPLEIVINPLVNWIWFGFGVLAFGTGIALLPDRAFSFATAKLPAEVATTAGMLILMLVAAGASPSAQEGMPAAPKGVDTQTSYYARTPLEKQLQHEIVCTCGCGHTSIGECRKDPCGTSHDMRGQLAMLVDQGKSHDEIIQAFVTKYGNEEMLGEPMDRGFRRLAWLLPWSVGVGAAALIGFVAVRWSRQHDGDSAEALPAADPELDERLDDELRNLD